MRKFFNFRSSSSISSSPTPPRIVEDSSDEKVCVKSPWESNAKKTLTVQEEDGSNSQLRRSHSFSSAAISNCAQEGDLNRDMCRSPYSCRNSPLNDLSGNSQASERYMRSKRGNRVQPSYAVDMLDSPSSSTRYQYSSENSSHLSPVPIRCRAARLTNIVNKSKLLDLYIDGEHRDLKARKFSPPNAGRPPRAQSTTPSSPTYSRGNARTYSLREGKEWTSDDLWPTSPQQQTRRYSEMPLHVFPQRTTMKSRESDSEITVATEDIYEDSSNPQPKYSSDLILPHDSINGYSSEESNTDEELNEKDKEVRQMLMLLSEEDHELEGLKDSSLTGLALLQTLRKIADDRNYLALELASQLKHRMADRSSSKERLKQTQMELEVRTRRLEKEKIELQSSLEKELDRRSSSWSLKLEKFQLEEQRLRERVRELAEQNVSLQREISLHKGNDVETRSRIINSEIKLNNMTTSLKEVQTENQDLRQAISDLQERCKGAEEECECLRISNKQREKEIKEFQRVVVRLQRTCNEQDKTINGLRQGYSNEIGKSSVDRDDNLTKLQMEQLRLTEVEQMLRKEVEACRREVDSLRHENMCLLDRLRGSGNSCGPSSSKLDRELRSRADFLQKQGLSLLNDNVHFCGELLGFMKRKEYNYEQGSNKDFDGYPVAESTVKYQSLRRRVENYKRSVQTVVTVLDEISTSKASDYQPCDAEVAVPRQSKSQESKNAVELELKAETLLTAILQEKLCSKELELEQLQSNFASSVRAHDVLQTETQRLQDELSCLNHKTKDMKLQMLRKDESINQLEHDLQESTKELTATRSILMKVSGERDHMWEEVKSSRETIMLLDLEVGSLKKRIEALDEDILVKEGQIEILKDSLGDKPFDVICSPNSVDGFAVEY